MTETNKIDERCECCSQRLYKPAVLSKGYAKMLVIISEFIEKKGVNVVHPEKELFKLGLFSVAQRVNMTVLGDHGLVAKHESHGNWVLTRKGVDFLNGSEIWKVAAVEKATKRTVGHIEKEGKTTLKKLLGKNAPYWQGLGFTIESGRVIRASEI